MDFVIYDTADPSRRITVSLRTWRATLEILHRDRVLPREVLNRLVWRFGGEGTSISHADVMSIAEYLDGELIPRAESGEVPEVDSIYFDVVESGRPRAIDIGVGELMRILSNPTHDPESVRPRYKVDLNWLRSFSSFCRTSRGIGALQDGLRRRRTTR